MIIYNPHNEAMLKERIIDAKVILNELNAKHCFISGSFLFKEDYRDIDVFIVSRAQKKFECSNKKVKISVIDFNSLYSLFFHSVSKSCISKNLLPSRPLKVTLSDYWNVVNEAIPTLFNEKNKFHKNVRFLILYTEYFRTGKVLDTFELDLKIKEFKDYVAVLDHINDSSLFVKTAKKSYLKRFFYTQAGYYKDFLDYSGHHFLYKLAHSIINER